jgi:hypothetical protein
VNSDEAITVLSGGKTDPASLVTIELSVGDWILLGAALVYATDIIPVPEDVDRILRISATIGETMNEHLGPVDPAAYLLVDQHALQHVQEAFDRGRSQDPGRTDA